jgi:hypothetical protein
LLDQIRGPAWSIFLQQFLTDFYCAARVSWFRQQLV